MELLQNRTTTIRANLEFVQSRIIKAAKRANRNPEDVHLVVVTKSQPVEVIEATIEAGATILGENYPEESIEKKRAVENPGRVEWHMIGHLQSRKAKLVVQDFDMLHSLDSLSLAVKLNRLCEGGNRKLPVLLEFNVGGEESKSGWNITDETALRSYLPEIRQIIDLSYLEIRGLMTMPPIFEDPQKIRPYFQALYRLRNYLQVEFPEVEFSELSMGTSFDYEVAIEEGATFVRIGQAIVGPRPHK